MRIFFFCHTETCRFICSWHISLIGSRHFQSQTVVWKYIVWEWTFSLLGFVNRRINRGWPRFSLRNMQRKKGSKRIEILHTQTRCSSLRARCFIAGQTEKLWKLRTGHPGLQAAGPSQAAGRGPAFSKTRFLESYLDILWRIICVWIV